MEGVLELIPADDATPQSEQTVTQEITNEDGSVSNITVPQTENRCPHNAEFMAQPGIEGLIEQQRAEIAAAQLAAQQAAAAAAAGQAPPPASEDQAPPVAQ